MDFTDYFKKYEELVQAADIAFKKVANQYPECVKCQIGCSDCCYALFDLTLIEALYINRHFQDTLPETDKKRILDKADTADRQVYKLKRQAFKSYESGKTENEIIAEMAEKRIRCPLLNDEDKCDLYSKRPITCRLYGIPTSIGGKGHTCGISGFEAGKQYTTIYLDVIQNKLYELSAMLVNDIKSSHTKMSELLVPLSMALLTVYNDQYLGISKKEEKVTQEKGQDNV